MIIKQNDMQHYVIAADIGGTFARFTCVNLDNLHMDKITIYPCAEFPDIETALITYQKEHSLERIKQISIAIACPILGDIVSMTNCPWRFSIHELQQKLKLTKLKVINDFSAIAMSLPVLGHQELVPIGTCGNQDISKPRVVLGAGTGLGVAYLIPGQSGYMAYAGEGGHANWGASTELEWFIYTFLKNKYARVSCERLISGPGLENLYTAIAAFHQQEVTSLSAVDITNLAIKGQCALATATVKQFFAILGAFAGDLALTFGSFGGVYIAGGIVPRLLPLIHESEFRYEFENKGRFNNFNSRIPTYIVTAEQPGLLGAAVYLKQSLIGEYDAVC